MRALALALAVLDLTNVDQTGLKLRDLPRALLSSPNMKGVHSHAGLRLLFNAFEHPYFKISQTSLVESSWEAENQGQKAINANSILILGPSIIQNVKSKITSAWQERVS